MTYTITITRKTTTVEMKKGPWEKCGEREEKGEYSDQIKWVPAYAYAPDREVPVTTETKVLEQTVEDINLAAVIKAVNGL